MKTILFSMTMAMLVLGGPLAKAEEAFIKQFKASCFDVKEKQTMSETVSDSASAITVDAKIKEIMLEGYELMAVEREAKNSLNCVYRFQRSNESLSAIAAQMKSYEEQYQKLMSEDDKLDISERKLFQNAQLFTRRSDNMGLFEYRTSYKIDKDTHIHVFATSCNYPRGPVWDALIRETTLNLKLSAIITSNKSAEHCLYYFTPDLQRFSP